MSSNFDLRKFLTENQLTTTAKAVAEAPNIPMPGNKPKMPPVPGQGSNNQAPKNTGASDKAKAVAKEALFQVIASTATLTKLGVLDANEAKQLEDLCQKAMGNLDEGATVNEYEHHYRKVGGECRKYNDEGDYTVVSMHYCQYNEAEEEKQKAPISEMNGGYVEAMGPDFDEAVDLLSHAWNQWKNGPATEDEDIEPAKADILEYVKSLLK